MVEIPTQRQEYGKPVTISSHFKKRFKERTPLKNPERFLSLCIKRGWSLDTLKPGTFPYQYLADKAVNHHEEYEPAPGEDDIFLVFTKPCDQLKEVEKSYSTMHFDIVVDDEKIG